MDVKTNYEQYASFKEKQIVLAKMMAEASTVISDLHMEQYEKNLKNLSEKVENETFKIQVVGNFKNGKSTFINSFLGENILPAYTLPCTAVINEVKYSDKKKAILHFRNPLPEKLPADIPEKARVHMKKFEGEAIPPLEISYDEIEDYVVIPIGKDVKEMLIESIYEKVELFWPLDLLENNVEIIDSPGLNEHQIRTKVTMDYLSKADAIVFVLNATALCSQSEMSFIENNLKASGFEDPFFVVNRFDMIPTEKEREAVRKYAEMKLSEYTSNKIYFVSALNALEGKMQGDGEKMNKSGMSEFESALSDFLTHKKGKAKLSQPAKELKRILNNEALFKVIPMQKNILSGSLDEVKAKEEEITPKLANLRLKKEEVYNKILLNIEKAKPDIKKALYNNSIDIIESIPVWIDEFEPATKLGVLPNKEKAAAATQEIYDDITQKLEEKQIDWRVNILEPLLEQKAMNIFGSVEDEISGIFSEIDNITFSLTGEASGAHVENIPTWQRVAAVTGGLLLGNFGMAISGGLTGISKATAVSFAIEFVGANLLLAMGMLNPITAIALIIGAALPAILGQPQRALQNLKSQIKNDIVNSFSVDNEKKTEDAIDGIISKFMEIVQEVVDALDIEINEVENQLNSIIKEMENGKENVDAKMKNIEAGEEKIKNVSNQLDNLIFQLIEE